MEQEELGRIAEGEGHSRGPLPRSSGFRVHHREGQAVHAPNPQRQANGGCGGADRGGDGQGKADRREDCDSAHRSGVAGSTAASDVQSESRKNYDCQGPSRIAGRGRGKNRVHRRGGRATGWRRRADHSCSPRDRARRHRWHARLRRNSHQHWRNDQPRRRGCPRHGNAVRGRSGGSAHRRQSQDAHRRRTDVRRWRLDQSRRRNR